MHGQIVPLKDHYMLLIVVNAPLPTVYIHLYLQDSDSLPQYNANSRILIACHSTMPILSLTPKAYSLPQYNNGFCQSL